MAGTCDGLAIGTAGCDRSAPGDGFTRSALFLSTPLSRSRIGTEWLKWCAVSELAQCSWFDS